MLILHKCLDCWIRQKSLMFVNIYDQNPTINDDELINCTRKLFNVEYKSTWIIIILSVSHCSTKSHITSCEQEYYCRKLIRHFWSSSARQRLNKTFRWIIKRLTSKEWSSIKASQIIKLYDTAILFTSTNLLSLITSRNLFSLFFC